MASEPVYPGPFSLPRITTLLISLVVSLASGTNYVYSAYAPQLGSRLHITHTKLNVVGLAGNVGVYISGPIWGRIVDIRGPRILFFSAFFLLLLGYSGIQYFYNAGGESTYIMPKLSFYALVLCTLMTGAGGNGGLTGSVNSTAKTFSDKARGTTTGFVISGFGLSAFLFSTVAHAFFAGNTSSFLLLLALGTSLPMIAGFFLVKPIPLPPSESSENFEDGVETAYGEVATSTPFQREDDSRTGLLSGREFEDEEQDHTEYINPPNRNSLELSPSRGITGSLYAGSTSAAREKMEEPPNLYGKALCTSVDFWLLFTMLSLLSGTGLMYINNVGSMSQALSAKGNPNYDEDKALKWQAAQVSTISIMNFLGRILTGLTADFAKNRLGLHRSDCLILISITLLFSQISASLINNVEDLWLSSVLLGLGYGGVFVLFPNVAIEWFGMSHFSENWGYLCLSPMIGGYLFTLAFGRNLDAHEPPDVPPSNPASAISSARQCLEGRECYVSALHITIFACLAALALSCWAALRHRRKTPDLAIAASGVDENWDPEG